QDHHELPKSNHRFAPSKQGSSFGDRAGCSLLSRLRSEHPAQRSGEFPTATFGEYSAGADTATTMLRQGASLAGIGAVLRHRSPRTTAHYAKVDFGLLSEIAQPWPEVV